MLIGSWAAGYVVDRYQIEAGGHDWTSIWIVPAVMAAVVIALFIVLFKDPGVRRVDPEQTIEAPL